MKKILWIDTATGISADRLASALIGLGMPEQRLAQIIKFAAEELGMLDVHAHLEFLPNEGIAHRLHITPLGEQKPLLWEETPAFLEKALSRANAEDTYADFALRALSILHTAKTQTAALSPELIASLTIIGRAHTPYKEKAPYQPQPQNGNDGEFYIQLEPQYESATLALNSFSHIFVLSYLDKSTVPETTVRPPWKNDKKRYGIFATRSPNRPSPIGLTRVRLKRVEGMRIHTGALDLFDGTPILDIKPYIHTLDSQAIEEETGNDGWLEGSDHLELHRLGISHAHPGGSENLDQPRILVALLTGIALGLQYLNVDCSSTVCPSPLNSDNEYSLDMPAKMILDKYRIPYLFEGYSGAYVTPAGAAILAALTPEFSTDNSFPPKDKNIAYGLGAQILNDSPISGALPVLLVEKQTKD